MGRGQIQVLQFLVAQRTGHLSKTGLRGNFSICNAADDNGINVGWMPLPESMTNSRLINGNQAQPLSRADSRFLNHFNPLPFLQISFY